MFNIEFGGRRCVSHEATKEREGAKKRFKKRSVVRQRNGKPGSGPGYNPARGSEKPPKTASARKEKQDEKYVRNVAREPEHLFI
jgi:hypothetical protein